MVKVHIGHDKGGKQPSAYPVLQHEIVYLYTRNGILFSEFICYLGVFFSFQGQACASLPH